ncbi:MAG: (2Fe-2S)-binding protein [Acidimicrobiia bacterium]
MRFQLNGIETEVAVDGAQSLLRVLRENLGVTGSKDACEQGECGSCTILMDGQPVCSCLVLGLDAEGADIVTVEGLTPEAGLSPVQGALLDEGGVQCGYCTPGIVVAATHLLDQNPHPTDGEIRESLAGNICRCTGYGSIIRAVRSVQ